MKMNRTQINQADKVHPELDPTAIDHILATEDHLVPTSGFLASVMERVREEATAPPPIPFPWKRAIPGILLAVVVFGGGAFEFVRHALPAARGLSFPAPHLSAAFDHSLEQAAWVALALGVSLFSWLLSKRLAGRSGLL
jgi:hypothetical protein